MDHSKPIKRLIQAFKSLPGVGPRSAQRMAWHILESDYDQARELARALVSVKKNIRPCSVCFNYTDTDPCVICDDETRDRSVVCVVETTEDVVALERSGGHTGLYHVLGGTIRPTAGIGPDKIRVRELLERIKEGAVEEVILATNPTVEGEATAIHIAEELAKHDVRVTRLARGIPMGADLDFLDGDTLAKALQARSNFADNK